MAATNMEVGVNQSHDTFLIAPVESSNTVNLKVNLVYLSNFEVLHHFPDEVLLLGRWSLRDRNKSM